MHGSKFIFLPEDLQENDISPSEIGGKAVGFRLVAPTWIPPYFIVSTALIDAINSSLSSFDENNIKNFIDSKYGEQFKGNLGEIIGETDQKIIIRSSATTESLSDRGKHTSVVCNKDYDSFLTELSSLYHKWLGCDGGKIPNEKLAVVVQKYIRPLAKGHLSNERRVSNLVRDWLIEKEPGIGQNYPEIHTFKIFKHRISERIRPDKILCSSDKDLNDSLHIPASEITFDKKRVHFEWVWDGQTIWIVQADLDFKDEGDNPRKVYEVEYEDFTPSKLEVFKDIFSSDSGRWRKANNVVALRQCDLETACLWILDDPNELRCLMEGKPTSRLLADIDRLLVMPVVIRTDLSSSFGLEQRQMLPRTNTLTNHEDVVDFLVNTSKNLKLLEISESDFCFLAHHFVPSTSSAYCYASPDQPRVRIDSIWGLPDGLSYYSHDSFELIPEDEQSLLTKKRYKEQYLVAAENGSWMPCKTGVLWDWHVSIGKNSIFDIAKKTKSFASCLGSPVKLMWFIDVPKETGYPSNIPWYFEKESAPESIDTFTKLIYTDTNCFQIQTIEDIEEGFKKLDEEGSLPPLRLYPMPNFIRNQDYLEKAALLANKANVPILLYGSVLQHAYYQLTRSGVRVLCPDPLTGKGEKRTFEKLVRDKIPEKIRTSGESVTVKTIGEGQLEEKLREKINEEANELFWASTLDETVEELADLYEITEALVNHLHIDTARLDAVKAQKKENRGGFETGTVLVETREKPLIQVSNQSDADKGTRSANSSGKNIEREIQESSVKIAPVPSGSDRTQFIELKRLGLSLVVKYEPGCILIEFRGPKPGGKTKKVEVLQLELPLQD